MYIYVFVSEFTRYQEEGMARLWRRGLQRAVRMLPSVTPLPIACTFGGTAGRHSHSRSILLLSHFHFQAFAVSFIALYLDFMSRAMESALAGLSYRKTSALTIFSNGKYRIVARPTRHRNSLVQNATHMISGQGSRCGPRP